VHKLLEYRATPTVYAAEHMSTTNLIRSLQDVLGGTPVFAGTRVPIKNLLDYLQAGDDLNEFLDDFPPVTREQVVQVLELAKEELLARTGGLGTTLIACDRLAPSATIAPWQRLALTKYSVTY